MGAGIPVVSLGTQNGENITLYLRLICLALSFCP